MRHVVFFDEFSGHLSGLLFRVSSQRMVDIHFKLTPEK